MIFYRDAKNNGAKPEYIQTIYEGEIMRKGDDNNAFARIINVDDD